MIKSIVVHKIPMNHVAAMERWYYRDHAPEINRRFRPWLTRHESYFPVDAPADAREHGSYNWHVTEGWWREIPETGLKGNLSFAVPPVWPNVATCFVPDQPTNDFMGGVNPMRNMYCAGIFSLNTLMGPLMKWRERGSVL